MIGCLAKCIGRSGVLRERLIVGRLGRINIMRFSDVGFGGNITTAHQEHEFTNNNQHHQQLYTQRAYTPSQMSQQLLYSLTLTHSQQPIIHQLSLYFNKLLPFDYDYFTESLRRLIPYQQKLSMEEILMLFDLAIEYKIDNLVLEKQFVNELYCRVYAGVRKELTQYDTYVENVVGETYKQFEAFSKDHFQIISDEFKEQLQQQGQNHQIKQSQQSLQQPSITTTSKPVHNSSVRKNKSKQISPEMMNRITKIFVDYNCKHVEFNKLLLEVLTVSLDEGVMRKKKVQGQLNGISAQGLLTYAKLTVNLLQLYMTEYQSTLSKSKNKDSKYTHRSVKNIYKLQHFYYYEVAKMIEDKQLLTQTTNEQLLHFVHILSSFPIKRRSFRKSVGDVMIGEFKRREIQFEEMIRFFELSRLDNKLLQHFENKINQGKQLQQSNNKLHENLPQNGEKSQQSLVADSIIDPTQSHQTNQPSIFKMPLSLFKKVTKKKSKPKNKKPEENEVVIDLTQPEEEGAEIHNENKQVKFQHTQ